MEEKRKKVTIYLPEEVAEAIGEMRDTMQGKVDGYVERSQVVESAIRYFYEERFQKG